MTPRLLITILLNAVWMPLLIAAAAYVVLRFVRNASASTRYGILTVALFAALLLPVAAAFWPVHAEVADTPQQTLKVNATATTIEVPLPKAAHSKAALPAVTPQSHAPAVPQIRFEIPKRVAAAIGIVWAAFVLALLLRLVVSFAYLERLKRDALPLPVEYRVELRRYSEKRAGENLRLCVSNETVVPVAIGWFDAMVLIPRQMIDELAPSDLDRILLHEMAHLRRGDSFVNAVQQLGNALFFFSPGLAWIGRQLDLEREVACDDWVVERGTEAAPYANCLLRLAERTPWPHKALAAPGAFITRKSMSIRIERILHKTRNVRLRPAPGPLVAAFVVIAGTSAAGLWLSPSIAYPLEPETAATKVRQGSAPVRVKLPKGTYVRETTTATTRVKSVQKETPPETLETKVREASVSRTKMPVTSKAAPAPKTHPAAQPKPRAVTPSPLPLPLPSGVAIVAAATAAPSGDDYIAQMRSVFGQNLDVDQLIQLKSMGVTPEYVQQLRQAGLPNITPHQVVEARAMNITPASIAQMRSTWGAQLPFEDMVTLTAMHVDKAYASSMESAGLHGVSARQLVELKSVGVTPEYIRQANAMGFGTLSARQLVQMKALGIDAAYVQRVRAHGFNNLTLEQLVQLKASGLVK